MQFGHFDDAKKEYVITSPKTPLPWINYLGSENFFSLISNTCGGYSFYKDAKLLRLTRYRYNDTPLDQNGRYYYIKDGDTVWNPGWQPTQTPLDSYECHHGLGYSRFVSSKNLVAAELTAFVPLADSCEVNRLVLTNNGTEEKALALTSFVEFCFWNAMDDMTNFQRNFSIGEVEIQGSEIYHKTEYRERRRHYAVYAVNCPINGYDTDRDAFLGAYRGNDRPETVLRGTAGNTVASGWGVIGSHHIDVTLKPGESRSFIFVLGYCENAADDKWEAPGVINKKPAKEMLSHYQTDEQVDAALAAAFLSAKLPFLGKVNVERRNIAQKYLEGINNPEIVLPFVPDYAEPVWHIFGIRCDRRAELEAFLNEAGIGTNKHYPIPIHLQECYRNLGFMKGDYPIAEKISETELSIPMYYGMTNEEIQYVIDRINRFE